MKPELERHVLLLDLVGRGYGFLSCDNEGRDPGATTVFDGRRARLSCP